MYKSLGKLSAPWSAPIYKATNPNNPLFTLNRLAHSKDDLVRQAARCSLTMNLEEGMRHFRAGRFDPLVLADAISRARCLGEKLSGKESSVFMDGISRFIKNAGTAEIEMMARSSLFSVRRCLAVAQNAPKPLLMELACEDASYASSAWWQLKMSGTLTSEDLGCLYLGRNDFVRQSVPTHTAASADLLQKIAAGFDRKAAETAETKLKSMGIPLDSEGGMYGGSGIDSTMHGV